MSRFFKSDLLAVYVAIMALIASQFPPVHTYFQSAQADLRLAKTAGITHSFGNTEIIAQITASNEGEIPFKIEQIWCELEGGNASLSMNGDRYYLERVTDNNIIIGEYFPLMHGLINKGVSISMNVVCAAQLSAEQEDRIHNLSTEIESEQTNQLVKGCAQRNDCPATLRVDHLEEAQNIFAENFNLDAGIYKFRMIIRYENGKTDSIQRSLSLTKNDIKKLNDLPLYYYRTGGGNIMGRNKIIPVNKSLSDK